MHTFVSTEKKYAEHDGTLACIKQYLAWTFYYYGRVYYRHSDGQVYFRRSVTTYILSVTHALQARSYIAINEANMFNG